MRTYDTPRHRPSARDNTLKHPSDETIGDLLDRLYALIDAYEEDHADALQRLRVQRHRELYEHDDQLTLPLQDERDEPF